MHNWTEIERLPGGLRLFKSDQERHSRYAIADESGATPDQTDDGILWLNPEQPIEIGTEDDGEGRSRTHISIPLTTPTGEAARTIGSISDALILAAFYRFDIVEDGRRFTVRGGDIVRG